MLWIDLRLFLRLQTVIVDLLLMVELVEGTDFTDTSCRISISQIFVQIASSDLE